MVTASDSISSLPSAKIIHERLALAMEASAEGIYDWDVETNDLAVSDRLYAILGFAPGELDASFWNERVHPDDYPAYRAAIVEHLKGASEKLVSEYRIRRKAGDFIWIADNGIAIRADTGRAIRLVGAVRNITARKLAEQSLLAAREDAERSQRQLVDAIEAMSEGIVLFDEEDRVIVCNSNYRGYFLANAGPEVAEMVQPGAMFWDFFRAAHARGMFPLIPDDDFEAYIEKRREMRRQPRESVEQNMSDGRWLQINECRTADGGIASVYTDITKLKWHEAELAEKSDKLENMSGKLAKYLSPQVYASIFSGEQDVQIVSKRKKLTVFFSDIVEFTETADSLESEELTSLLNQYLSEMSRIALDYGATIDKFIGDAILAFFGDPLSNGVREDAASCVRMAVAMQQRMQVLQEDWREKGLERAFQLRIGINTGYCTVGNFGSDDRMDYTVIGNEVNLAARLQAHAEPGAILLAGETYALVKDDIVAEQRDAVTLKGIARPVQCYAVTGLRHETARSERVIHHEESGFRLTIDREKLAGESRSAAIAALEAAARDLKDDGS